jgi:hypothetical protein
MKKILLLGLLLVVIASGALAQDAQRQMVFDPDTTFLVTDLGIVLLYPEDWVYDTSDGIQFAENNKDLAAELDDSDETQALGYQVNFTGYPVEIFGLDEGSDVDDIADLVVGLAELEVFERFDFPVMSYRGVAISGVDPSGQEGIAVVWIQNDFMILYRMGMPKGAELTADAFFTFGYLIGAMRPMVEVEFTETAEVDWQGGFTMDYPEDWVAGETTSGYFVGEFEDDVENAESVTAPSEGMTVFFQTMTLEDLGLDKDGDAWDVFDFLLALDMYDEMTHVNEHIIFDSLAISMRSVSVDNQVPVILVVGVYENEVFAIGAKAPDADSMELLAPILLTMLQSAEFME